MTDRSWHIALKSLNIIRQAIQKSTVLYHSLASKHLPLDKFFNQTVIFPGCFHGLIIIEESLLTGIAAKNSSAPHKIYCLKHNRKFQFFQCLF